MAINRFYRPSQPAYTSQFVEEQYPVDLMMQQGAMKYSQAQQFYENVGKLQALNESLTPGYRTTRVAPEVRSKYESAIQQFTDKYSDSYDSPQALLELSRLRSMWANDPDVQLVMYDREMGNKERNQMLGDTDTYHLDIDKNVNPETGELKQFNPGDSYIGYQPLVKWVDVPKYIKSELDKVPWEEGTAIERRKVIDPATGQPIIQEVETDIKRRDYNTFAPAIQALINRFRQGGEEWTEYLRARVGGDATDEELAGYFANLAAPLIGQQARSDYSHQTERGFLGEDYGGTGQRSTFRAPGTQLGTEQAPKKGDITKEQIKSWFGKDDYDFKKNDFMKNLFFRAAREENPEIVNKPLEEQRKFMKQYLGDKDNPIYQPTTYNIERVDEDTRKEMTNFVFGPNAVSGKLNADNVSPVFRGATVYDYEGGNEILSEDKKQDLFKKDQAVSYVGPIADTERTPHPNMHMVTIGDKMYTMSWDNEGAEQNRAMYNLAGYRRANVSGIGDTFFMRFQGGADNPNPIKILDKTMRDEFKGNYNNIEYNTPDGLYAKSVLDYSDGEPKVKVYALNPKDYGILENENPAFIKEYNINEEGGIENVYRRILQDRDELLTRSQAIKDEIDNELR